MYVRFMQETGVLEGLAAIPAGPELAAALHALPLSRVPNDRMLEVLTAQYRQLCHTQARMAAVLTELARCPAPAGPGRVTRTDEPDRYAPAETRAALRWTRRSADGEHDLAESVVHGMPAVFAAWSAGVVDRPRVRVFAQYLTGLTAEQIERISRVAVPRAPRLTTGQLAHLLRRMVIAVDPDAAARWYRQGIRDRNVVAYPAPDGTITIAAHGLPVDQADAACQRIQNLAAAAKRAGHPGLIGQIRCDLFVGLLDGRFHGMTTKQVIAALIADYRPGGPAGGPEPGRATSASGHTRSGRSPDQPVDLVHPEDPGHSETSGSSEGSDLGPPPNPAGPGPVGDQRVGIEIRVGLATLLGHDEHPAEIPGLGLLVAPDARHRVALQGLAEWRFAVTDADGALISEGLTRRRPAGMGRDGPPGGIVELHVPAALLQELEAHPRRCGGWTDVVADIAAQHADRDRRLADLDARPGDRLPGTALRRHTEIRDRTCTFAGVCRRSARTSQMDHSRDHARGGATRRTNLGPLCDHDHHVKHRAGWTVSQPDPGTFIWHSPLGGEYATRGEILLPDLPEPAPTGPHAWTYPPIHTLEGPILYRPPRLPPDRPPKPPREYPDPPPF